MQLLVPRITEDHISIMSYFVFKFFFWIIHKLAQKYKIVQRFAQKKTYWRSLRMLPWLPKPSSVELWVFLDKHTDKTSIYLVDETSIIFGKKFLFTLLKNTYSKIHKTAPDRFDTSDLRDENKLDLAGVHHNVFYFSWKENILVIMVFTVKCFFLFLIKVVSDFCHQQ